METTITKPRFLPEERGDQIMAIIALGALFYVGYLLFFHEPVVVKHQALKIGVITTQGSVMRRHARSLHWTDIKREGELFLRDIVYTPQGTEATITFLNKKSIKLEPETMVQLDEMTLDQIRITLMDGKVKGDAIQKGDLVVTRTTVVPFKLAPYPKIHTVDLLEDVVPLKARYEEWASRVSEELHREVTLIIPKEVQVISTFSLNEIKDYDVKLLSPGPERFNVRSKPWLMMEWTKVPIAGIEYVLEVAREETFHGAITLKTKETHLQVQFSDEGNYFWRVKAVSGGKGIRSNTATFSMTRVGGKTTGAAIQVPKSEVKGFTVDIAKDKRFDEVVKSEIVNKPGCSATGLSEGEYYCRIKSLKTGKEKIIKLNVQPKEDD